jgi:hypothetical protein
MPTFTNDPVVSVSKSPNAPAVSGESSGWEGVHGISHGPAAGVAGFNDAAQGVAQPGVWGESKNAEGVHGVSHGPAAGVVGDSQNGDGVGGTTRTGSQSGVFGINMAKGSVPDGLNRPGGAGVWGHTTVEKGSGVVGSVDPGLQQAAGVIGIGPIAGHFFGDVIVTGDIKLANGDCAEEFDIRADISVEAGTVMVLGDDGSLYPSEVAYDKRVAGAVSGAGEYKPGIVLDKQQSDGNRQPIALLGKVYCKVDASFAPVKIGDLLTTSPTPGHAMKATDQFKAFGAVIGKALRPLSEGQELIPVLIALQ